MRRSADHPVHTTLMEVYTVIGCAGAAPCEAIEAAMSPVLAGLLQGERHGEGFVPCV